MIHNASFMEIILLQNGLLSIDSFYIISHNPKNNLLNVPIPIATQSFKGHSQLDHSLTNNLNHSLTSQSHFSAAVTPSVSLHFAHSSFSTISSCCFQLCKCTLFYAITISIALSFSSARYVTLVFTWLMVAWFRFSCYCSLVSSENEVNSCLFKGWLIMPIKCLLKCLCGENKHFFFNLPAYVS